jgi:hypothetical protein
MTEYADIPEEDHPVYLAGMMYDGVANLKLQVWDFHAKEFFNALYFRADHERAINDHWSWFGSAQYLSQKDSGDRIGGDMDSHTYALEGGLRGYGFKASLANGKVGDDEIRIPWGHDLICSIMVNDTVRAEETGILGALQYDFGQMGIDGLVIAVKHLDFNTPDRGENASPDMTETDFDITYQLAGFFENTSLRVRHGIVNQEEALGGEDYGDTRIMVKYGFGMNL